MWIWIKFFAHYFTGTFLARYVVQAIHECLNMQVVVAFFNGSDRRSNSEIATAFGLAQILQLLAITEKRRRY